MIAIFSALKNKFDPKTPSLIFSPQAGHFSRDVVIWFYLPNVKTEPRPGLAQFVRKHEM
jgi:hypothetical protein